MSEPPPPYNHLAHLEHCPDCLGDDTRADQYMTIMFMSQGRNNASSYGAWCKKCCVLAHVETPSIPPCPSSSHALALQKETGKLSTQPPKDSAKSTPRPIPAVGSSSTGASSPFLERHTSFAIPLSDSYRSRLNELDNANLDRVSSATDNHLFSRQTAKTIVVQWWSENDTEPETIDVHAPYYPHFHPVHSPDLISLYGVDTTPFEIFHPLHNIWKTGTKHTPPQAVDKETVLQFRSRGVRSGVGMPRGSIMRLGANNRLLGTSANSSNDFSSTPNQNEMPVSPSLPPNPSTPITSTSSSSRGMDSPTTSPAIGFKSYTHCLDPST
ncbi:hypothetical protein C8F04DRAFT_1260257 [Mycena alexandri]|uniref:Uncharacterized protein n=1 Tax=Mycena alexandri TaxID=1745969 RepID=A0AAD6STY1_9AGAR|nr:hypothetical protein C8F04DRAFT_1260257 [Mycena alexandri]